MAAASGRISSAQMTSAAATRSSGTDPAGRSPPRPASARTRHPLIGVGLGGEQRVAVPAAAPPAPRCTTSRPRRSRRRCTCTPRRTGCGRVAVQPGQRVGQGDGRHRRVGVRVGRREGGQRVVDLQGTVEHLDPVEHHGPVVNVQVLSVASSVTRARVSTACSCCTSTCARPSRITATACAMLQQQHQALGDERHEPGDGADQGVVELIALAVALGEEQAERRRHDDPRHDAQDQVDALFERRCRGRRYAFASSSRRAA